MPIEVIVASIALLGVVISTIIAYFTSTRQSKIETDKLRHEIYQDFSVKLFEKRLELYPLLYNLLSKYIKRIQANDITQESLHGFLDALHEWDNTHSILFSAQTGKKSYDFRNSIAELATLPDKELKEKYMTVESRRELRHRFQEMELALKSELGIYAFDKPIKASEFPSYQRYGEIPIGRD